MSLNSTVVTTQPGSFAGRSTEELAFETIRELLLRLGSKYIRGEVTDDSLADAVYLLLRGHRGLDIAVDGWTAFHVIRETTESLKAVGIMTILPVDELPLEVEIWRESNEVQHLVRIGLVDERWDSLSESKRWKAVYFYATEGRDIDWTWSEPISGQMSGE